MRVSCCLLVGLVFLSGCNHRPRWYDTTGDRAGAADPEPDYRIDDEPMQSIPWPISLTLPKRIKIHPFTQTQDADPDSGAVGVIDVRAQLLDSFGDPTKGFGHFRFTLFAYRLYDVDRKGRQLAIWKEDLSDPDRNMQHWDPISNAYKFNLEWGQPMPSGQRYILEAYFSSPYTEQLLIEQTFESGE